MRTIKNIKDVVDWGLCVGCGICFSVCEKEAVTLFNFQTIGIRPVFNNNCKDCNECLTFCPGHRIDANLNNDKKLSNTHESLLIGPTLDVWEAFAADNEIRNSASSGGILTALALYCLEKENMEFVLHTGMNPRKPWTNCTVQSRNRNDLLSHAGSRYQSSSPCESLRLIEESKKQCVFIGRPCDVAAVSMLRKQRPKLDANLGLVLSFFCAGTPSTQGTLDLLTKLHVNTDDITDLHYRGNGWPGGFSVICTEGENNKFMSYKESWNFLQKYRTFRCQICPDGLGELSDITSGDAWNKYSDENEDPGRSLVLIRSQRGNEIIHKATSAGFITLLPSSPSDVIRAQGLIERRKIVFGRQLAMKMLLIPTTNFIGFHLFKSWIKISLNGKIKSILGTLRRLIQRGLWHRNTFH